MSTPISVASSVPVLLPQLLQGAGLEVPVPAESSSVRITALTDDSRCVVKGACFVAVCGGGHDGHHYIQQAIDGGAGAIVVERDVDVPSDVVCIRVQETRSALARLAAAFHGLRGEGSSPMRLVGVTGTNGKTTVSWILRSILQAAGCRPALLGTVEYDLFGDRFPAQLTTPGPIELARLLASARNQGADSCILEVSSHALDQHRTDGIAFSAGVFTNLSGDHLDYHGDAPAYLRAKRRLFESLDSNAVAVINRDDASGLDVAAGLRAPVVWYGLSSQTADVRARIESSTDRGCRVSLRGRTYEIAARCGLVGRHNVYNVLAAAATAEWLGIDPDSIRAGIERLAVVPGRLQRIDDPGVPFSVFVDYAHTDDALRNALQALRSVTEGRLICIFGCGDDRDRSKRPRMGAVVGALADLAFVTSDNPRTENPAAIVEDIVVGFDSTRRAAPAGGEGGPQVLVDRRRAIEAAISTAGDGDVVLIAGKGHENYQLIGDRVLDFDDAAVVRECLAKLQPCSITGGAA